MNRTRLADRELPGYTRGEELFNMISHIVGGGLGVVVFLTCIIVAAYNQNIWNIVSGGIYGFTVILLFTMSSLYHGLNDGIPKKVFQIIDHCTVFILIAGTYTPIVLGQFRVKYPLEAWLIFSIVWGLAILGIVLNSIDLKRYNKFSIICYLGMGWMIVFRLNTLIDTLGATLFVYLLLGGIFYTIGAVFYVIGKKNNLKYMHPIFHIFVDIAALLHFIGIVVYVMPV